MCKSWGIRNSLWKSDDSVPVPTNHSYFLFFNLSLFYLYIRVCIKPLYILRTFFVNAQNGKGQKFPRCLDDEDDDDEKLWWYSLDTSFHIPHGAQKYLGLTEVGVAGPNWGNKTYCSLQIYADGPFNKLEHSICRRRKCYPIINVLAKLKALAVSYSATYFIKLGPSLLIFDTALCRQRCGPLKKTICTQNPTLNEILVLISCSTDPSILCTELCKISNEWVQIWWSKLHFKNWT